VSVGLALVFAIILVAGHWDARQSYLLASSAFLCLYEYEGNRDG